MQPMVIIPTYNERENLCPLVREVLAVDQALDVLVVDDNSPDGTGDLADALARESTRVHVLHRQRKEGIGLAYLAGFAYALARHYDYVVEMDGDFSHAPADLPRLLAPIRDGAADLVLGSRWVAGGGVRHWPLRRQALSRLGSWYAALVLGAPFHDLTTGFKAFRRRVLGSLRLDAIRSTGYSFQIELTYRAFRAGFRIQEIPIIFTERIYGQSKLSSGIVTEALRLVWHLRLSAMPAPAARRLALRRTARGYASRTAAAPLAPWAEDQARSSS